MKQREIYITQFDKERLEELIEVAETFGAHTSHDLQNLENLREELEQAIIVSSKKVPPKVVTLNSKVLLRDVDTNEEMNFTLVFPKDANIESGAISVLAPIGTAILGYREGHVVEWQVPSGTRRISIEKILYQPEAAGDFHL
ncbi:MAG TPA: nucleoside diphosphate kinase regulator [Thermodesulfobacteriota bacterium]|nr:nucleoside diphosphate kinase regulator [Deltaproteobacteria bacterium]HNR14783.1 nucleoside diphosphate kinase regulator [Thermodesulfobacteriota bacterium]HNU71945.1 nucleoside diphosphate kinase regulator [Thermodesulfobacteriota bacterium]HOC38250.1 nucleoside diphosphate kinase regulator [Thermodesulfobacteriota bacterium]HQO78563.1 nucleoside diphosphate kinase regulator [Thermodesulfobacteriota bacterium]